MVCVIPADCNLTFIRLVRTPADAADLGQGGVEVAWEGSAAVMVWTSAWMVMVMVR
jgi:hypothetical protein